MKKQIRILPPLALATLSLLLVASIHAEITLVDSVGFANTTGSGDDTDGNPATRTVGAAELGGFDANGVDKLVVTVGGEGNSNGAESNLVTSVTYGGGAMLPVLARYGNGNRGTSMWYLDDVSTSGEFVITFTQSQSGLGFGAYALSGTLAGFAETASTTATMNPPIDAYNADMEMTTTLPGEFIVAAFARNNFDDGPNDEGVVAPLIQLFYGGTDGSSAAGAYQFVASPGTVTPTIYRLSNGVGSVIAASFQPAPETSDFRLTITPTPASPGNYDFSWESHGNKLYDLVSSTGLSTEPAGWPVWDGRADIPSGGTGTSLTNVPGGTDPTRFFAVIEKDPEPVEIFSENFDGAAGPGLPTDWTSGTNPADNSSTTNWELGTPANVGPVPPGVPLPSGANCVATNISGNYDDPVADLGVAHTDIWLRSPSIDLGTATAGTLSFQQWTQIEDVPGDLDYGSIRILDASNDSELAVMENRSIDGNTTGWEEYSMALPAAAFTATSGTIKVEWRFEADDIDSFAGWYIDDVVVTTP